MQLLVERPASPMEQIRREALKTIGQQWVILQLEIFEAGAWNLHSSKSSKGHEEFLVLNPTLRA